MIPIPRSTSRFRDLDSRDPRPFANSRCQPPSLYDRRHLYYFQRLPPPPRLPIVSLEFANMDLRVVNCMRKSGRGIASGPVSRTAPRKFSVFRNLASKFLKTIYLTVEPSLQRLEKRQFPPNPPGGDGGGTPSHSYLVMATPGTGRARSAGAAGA